MAFSSSKRNIIKKHGKRYQQTTLITILYITAAAKHITPPTTTHTAELK